MTCARSVTSSLILLQTLIWLLSVTEVGLLHRSAAGKDNVFEDHFFFEEGLLFFVYRRWSVAVAHATTSRQPTSTVVKKWSTSVRSWSCTVMSHSLTGATCKQHVGIYGSGHRVRGWSGRRSTWQRLDLTVAPNSWKDQKLSEKAFTWRPGAASCCWQLSVVLPSTFFASE